MEFLDDLREQRKMGKQSPHDPNSPRDSESSDDDPWEALLGGTGADDAGGAAPQTRSKRRDKERPKKSRAEKTRAENTRPEKTRVAKGAKTVQRGRGARRGLSGGQMLILGVLAVFVIGILIVIAAVFSGIVPIGGVPGGGADANLVAADPGTGPSVEPDAAIATVAPTAQPARVEVLVTVTPAPTATPVPPPVVSTVYDNQILRDPDNVELYLKRGATYLDLGVYSAALADYEHAIALDDQNSEGYVGLGWSHYSLFSWDGAESAFATALALDKNASAAHFGLGLLRYYQGVYGEAAREFDEAAELNPLNAEAEAWFAMSVAAAGDVQEAFDAVNRALLIAEKKPIIYIARSWSHQYRTPPDLEAAHGDLLYALGLGPNQFITLNGLAAFYAEHRPDRLSEAEVRAIHAREWAANDVERALSLQTLGRVYLAMDRKEDAARVLLQAVDLATVEGKTYLVGLEDDLLLTR
jgi:tetratricopeptide (TPR) repeat protein